MNISSNIFEFIRNLPQFQRTSVEGKSAALRVTDGAFVFVPSDQDEQENGYLLISWGNASGHVCSVNGVHYASLMIVEASNYYVATGHHNNLQRQVEELSEHFFHKTGERIWIGDYAGSAPEVIAVTKAVGNAILGALTSKVI